MPKYLTKTSPFMNEAGDGADLGGGKAITPEVQALIDAEVAGLKAKNAELIGANKKLRDEHQSFVRQFEGVDITAMKELLARTSQDEEARLLATGKADEVVNRRTERLRAEYDKKLQDAERQLSVMRERAMADAIRAAAVKAGALPEAADDFVYRSRGQFQFNESGDVVAVDREGQVIYGRDGKTPMTPGEWAESLRDSAPHLWPRATGAGAAGNSGGKATKALPEMSEAERVALYRSNPEQFRQLAAQQSQKG